MAYATYTTKALVCGTKNSNTADRSFLLFTRDAGMLFANARSVRQERSRQRYALQDFSLIKVSLVKGRGGWRIGSVEAIKNYYNTATSKEARGSVVRMFRLLRRFVQGEESNSELFDQLLKHLEAAAADHDDREFLEQLNTLTILTELGYIDRKKIPESIDRLQQKDIDASTRKAIQKLLDRAVEASHL